MILANLRILRLLDQVTKNSYHDTNNFLLDVVTENVRKNWNDIEP